MAGFYPLAAADPFELKEYEARSRLTQYVALPRDDVLRSRLQEVLSNLAREKGTDVEKTLLCVTGDSGAGKSRALKKLLGTHPAFPGYGGPDCALVATELDAPAPLKVVGENLLKAMGYELQRDLREYQVWREVYHQMEERGTKMFWIDEFFHVTRCNGDDEKKKIRDTVKTLLLRRKGLILSGLDEYLPLLESDIQIKRRAFFVDFPKILATTDYGFVEGVVVGSCRSLGLQTPDDAVLVEACHRLIHASDRQVGSMVCLAHAAAARAYSIGAPQLGLAHFAEAYAKATSNDGPIANPFLRPDWSAVDCRRVLNRQDRDADHDDRDESRTKAVKGRGKRRMRKP